MSANATSFRQRSPLVSVHKLKIKCPVCGHRDNCAWSDAGTYCRRVRSPHIGRDGGWWHPKDELVDNAKECPALRVVTPPLPKPGVDKGVRDVVYRTLLHCLALSDAHFNNLSRRSLNREAIKRGRFKSTPTPEKADEVTAMIAPDADLSGIAGFYQEKGRWRMARVPAGFFIPVLDRHGLIQGLQIRRDELRRERDSRYLWFSSSGYSRGTSSGAPAHVQSPERIIASGKCMVTEGALKSFIAAEYMSHNEGGFVALAGVSTFKDDFGHHLKEAFPGLHSVAIAFDRDWREKREVKVQVHRLARVLRSAKFASVAIRTWDATEKGIDDYLVAEAQEANDER